MCLGVQLGGREGLPRNFRIILHAIVDGITVLQSSKDRIDRESGAGDHRRAAENVRVQCNVPIARIHAPFGMAQAVSGEAFGSDGETGARFTALLYSVVATLKANGIDVRRWLEAWLQACARNNGRPPDGPSPWLPWSMSEEHRRALTAPG